MATRNHSVGHSYSSSTSTDITGTSCTVLTHTLVFAFRQMYIKDKLFYCSLYTFVGNNVMRICRQAKGSAAWKVWTGGQRRHSGQSCMFSFIPWVLHVSM